MLIYCFLTGADCISLSLGEYLENKLQTNMINAMFIYRREILLCQKNTA